MRAVARGSGTGRSAGGEVKYSDAGGMDDGEPQWGGGGVGGGEPQWGASGTGGGEPHWDGAGMGGGVQEGGVQGSGEQGWLKPGGRRANKGSPLSSTIDNQASASSEHQGK